MEKIEIEASGYDLAIKKTKKWGNSGGVIVPKSWIGKEVMCILREDESQPPLPQQVEEHNESESCKEGWQLFRDVAENKIDISVYHSHLYSCTICQNEIGLDDDEVEMFQRKHADCKPRTDLEKSEVEGDV